MIFRLGKYKYSVSLRGILPIIENFSPCNITDIDNSLSGKVTVVVGGNSGIGLSIVKEYLNHGARVIAAARKLGELADYFHERLEFIEWNVSKVSESEEKINYIIDKYRQIDCVVLSAGVNICPDSDGLSFLEKKRRETYYIHQINVIGVCEICKILKRHTLDRHIENLKIINIISSGALLSVPEPYFTSKHAFYSFTKAFSIDCGSLIRVYGIAPGEVRTKMIYYPGFSLISEWAKDHRKAHPDEIAKLALHLTLPGGDALAGNIVVIDGGETILKQF